MNVAGQPCRSPFPAGRPMVVLFYLMAVGSILGAAVVPLSLYATARRSREDGYAAGYVAGRRRGYEVGYAAGTADATGRPVVVPAPGEPVAGRPWDTGP